VRRCSDGSALPIITTPGGKLFVLSEEGLEYEVVLQADKGFPVVPANMAVEVGGAPRTPSSRQTPAAWLDAVSVSCAHPAETIHRQWAR
jgi:hypothetical protein